MGTHQMESLARVIPASPGWVMRRRFADGGRNAGRHARWNAGGNPGRNPIETEQIELAMHARLLEDLFEVRLDGVFGDAKGKRHDRRPHAADHELADARLRRRQIELAREVQEALTRLALRIDTHHANQRGL